MFCSNCGNELTGSEKVCPMCGEPVARTSAGQAAATAPAAVPAPAPVAHTSYEYARTTVSSDLATVATDCYENLGYELTGSKSSGTGTTALSFRRSRKVRGKAQLAKIQRTMDDLLVSLACPPSRKRCFERSLRTTTMTIATMMTMGLMKGPFPLCGRLRATRLTRASCGARANGASQLRGCARSRGVYLGALQWDTKPTRG